VCNPYFNKPTSSMQNDVSSFSFCHDERHLKVQTQHACIHSFTPIGEPGIHLSVTF